MAKLPKNLIRKPKPTLGSIKVGEIVFVESTDMGVTENRECFLQPTATYEGEATFMHNLRIKRAKDGFHVAVLTKTDWEANTSKSIVKDWLPVASIVVELNPDLDIGARLEKLNLRAEKRAAEASDRAKKNKNKNVE